MLIKLGESVVIRPEDIRPVEKLANDSDLDIENRMYKFAQELKVIAPKAKDFLYFTCVMMHAAEAACINDDGTPKKTSTGENVVATWEKVGDGVKWICNDKNIKAYKNNNCFVPGTDILMADGSSKSIENIQANDEVITHDGTVGRVSETFVRQHEGDILKIRVKNKPPLFVTKEHPFWAIPNLSTKSINYIKASNPSIGWIEAKNLISGDVLISPVIEKEIESDLTPNQARLLGLFAAEGSFSKKYNKLQGAIFTFGINEIKIANLVKEIFDEEFPECSVKVLERPVRSVINVTVSGHGIADWFYYHVGEYSHTKKLSNELVFGSKEVKRQFLLGWLEGDGCITEGNKIVGITTSESLAWQAYNMLSSIGILSSIRKIIVGKKFISINSKYKEYAIRPHYRLEVYGAKAEELCRNDSVKYIIDKEYVHKNIDQFYEGKTLHRITEIVEEEYNGPVYNFEVEGKHSYIANGIAVHNCDIFPRDELKKVYKLWVGRPLCIDHKSSSVEAIRGVIVDTVYDDKRDRIIALCALDKKNYPELADKVKTGVSNNVSMGVGVGRAVCSECQRAARTEKEFCQHMKNKSCYGEINLDLNPIELSLVVAGADPKAKVKHVIASDIAKAAELLSDYLQVKAEGVAISRQDLTSIQEDVKGLADKINSMIRDSEEDESEAVGPTRSRWSMEESNVEPSTQINVPEAFPTYASELQKAILGAQTKLASLQENLLRLSNSNEEPTMTTKKNAYFQGTEEPTPGKAQYQVDPLNEKARLMDKNLHGPAPFPNTGNEDGMFPGDDKVKKELQRMADANERAMFREAALKKAKEQLMSQGYFQGTEEPKPGKVQYPIDPLEKKDRMEDKQMVGKKPFPEVGKVDGLYDDDEKEKEKLLRASLKARFEKIALPDGRVNKSASSWVVLANDKPILRASVDHLTKGNSDALYDAVATERFGRSLLNRIQTEGFEATASALGLLKSAQAAPAAPPPAPPAAPMGGDLPPLEPPASVDGEKGGDTDTIVDDLQSLYDEMGGKLSDLRDKVSGPVAEDADAIPDVAPAADEEFADGPKTASQLQSMRKRVNGMLQEGIDETITSLAKHMKEIDTAKHVYKEKYASMTAEQRDYLNELTISAVKDAKAMLAETGKLMEAVVKYAHGTAGLEKNAAIAVKSADDKILDTIFASDESAEEKEEDKANAEDTKEETDEADAADKDEEESADAKDGGGSFEDWLANVQGKGASDESDAKLSLKAPNGTTQELGEVTVTAGGTLELSTKEGRAQARIKLAEKGLLGFNEMSNSAHPGGSVSAVDAGNLDVTPKAPGAAFHVKKDIQEAMLEVANMPPRVRKQAEMIQALVAEGRLKVEDVDQLVANGVDADAVKYWKELFSQGDAECKDFASKLTQEHMAAKKADEVEAYKGRLKRSYEVANQMVTKGLITEAQLDSQVNDIMKWNDAGFESIKKILTRQSSMNKQASLPVVGLMDSGSIMLPAVQNVQQGGQDLQSLFADHFESKGLKF